MSPFTFTIISKKYVAPQLSHLNSIALRQYSKTEAKIISFLSLFLCCFDGVVTIKDNGKIWYLNKKDVICLLKLNQIVVSKKDKIADKLKHLFYKNIELSKAQISKPPIIPPKPATITPILPTVNKPIVQSPKPYPAFEPFPPCMKALVPPSPIATTFKKHIESMSDVPRPEDFNSYASGDPMTAKIPLFDALLDLSREALKHMAIISSNKKNKRLGLTELDEGVLEQQYNSLRVTYRPHALTAAKLDSLLGADQPKPNGLAIYRMVSSAVCFPYLETGEKNKIGPNPGKISKPTSYARVYSTSLPNFNYLTDFISRNGLISYQLMLEDRLKHFLEDCYDDGVQIPVIPLMSKWGNLYPDKYESEIHELLEKTLKKVLAQVSGCPFEMVIFATTDIEMQKKLSKLQTNVQAVCKNDLQFFATGKNPIKIAREGAEKGIKMGLLNIDSSNCVPGDSWGGGGPITPSGLLALFSSLVLIQEKSFNKNFDPKNYQARPIIGHSLWNDQSTSTVSP